MEFGFFIDKRRVIFDKSEIKPIYDIDHKIGRFYEHARVANGWIYPPLIEANQKFNEKQKFKVRPQIPSSFFKLEPTHTLRINPFDDKKAKFLILALGFLNGVYLCPAGHLCINRIPYETGKLTGVVPVGDDTEIGMTVLSNYFDSASPDQQTLAYATLHWFLLGQTYNFDWDRFDAQWKGDVRSILLF